LSNSFIQKKLLFYENHKAAENTAIICPLLASYKASQVNPKEWLTNIITWFPYYTKDKRKDLKSYYLITKNKENTRKDNNILMKK